MLKKTLLLLLVAYSFSAFGQDYPNTILWEVSKPGLKYKSYLFGTFHEVYPSFFQSLKNATQKLTSSSVLYVEQTRKGFVDSATINNNSISWNIEKWKEITNAEQRKVFEAFVQKSENTGYYNIPPLLLSLTLFQMYAQNFCDIAKRNSNELLDHYIERFAEERSIPVQPLDDKETIRNAFSASHNTLPDSVMANACIGIMRSMLDADTSACKIFDDYKNFNINYEFKKELNKQNNYVALLERNNYWMLKLDKAFRKNNCFVAVGFKHLMYRQGLIQQLKDLGYIVQPISTK